MDALCSFMGAPRTISAEQRPRHLPRSSSFQHCRPDWTIGAPRISEPEGGAPLCLSRSLIKAFRSDGDDGDDDMQ